MDRTTLDDGPRGFTATTKLATPRRRLAAIMPPSGRQGISRSLIRVLAVALLALAARNALAAVEDAINFEVASANGLRLAVTAPATASADNASASAARTGLFGLSVVVLSTTASPLDVILQVRGGGSVLCVQALHTTKRWPEIPAPAAASGSVSCGLGRESGWGPVRSDARRSRHGQQGSARRAGPWALAPDSLGHWG